MHHQGIAARKEDASLSGAANLSEHMSFARINDLTQQIVFADKVSRLHQTSENAGGRGMGVHNVIVAQLLRRNALLHLAGQNTTPNQKAQHGVDGNFGRHNINAIRFACENRVSPGIPDLPVLTSSPD